MSKNIFKIEIQETLSETIEIQAGNLNDAILKAKQMYFNEEIILNNQNHIETEFNVIKQFNS